MRGKKKAAKRRNASRGPSARAAMKASRTPTGARSKQSKALSNVAVAVGGGALGALAAGVAVGAGIKPQTAAVATLAGGAIGAYALKGSAKVAAIGAACAASGQLALAWQVKRQAEQDARKKADEDAKRAAALPPAPAQLPAATSATNATPSIAAARKNGPEVSRNASGWMDEDDRDGVVDDDLRNGGPFDEEDDYDDAM